MGQVARPLRPSLARLVRMSLGMDRANLRLDTSASHAAYPWLPSTSVRELARRADR
jgi:hypothetical protein